MKDFDFFSIADFFGFYKNDKVYFCHDNIQTNNIKKYNDRIATTEYPKFVRNTRIKIKNDETAIKILDPAAVPAKPDLNIVTSLMPAIAMFALVVVLRGVLSTTGGTFVLFSICSMGLGVVTSVISIFDKKKQYKKDCAERTETYLTYIEKKKKEIEEAREKELEGLQQQYYSIEEDIEHISSFSAQLFDRLPEDEDFLRFIRTIFASDKDAELFETSKKNTIEKFRKNYKNGEFRALYKAFEYSDANKGYKLYDLIEGLQKINYETFINENKLLIVPDNCCLYINGKLQDISCEAVEQINTIFAENQHTATLGGTMSEQRLKDDAHLLEVARENVNVDILSLGFETNISVLDRMIYLLFQSQKILAENKILHIDTFDSSIIMQTEEVIKMKMMLKNVLKEEAFEQTRKHVLGVINQWLEMDPMRFNMLAVELKIENVQIIDFLNIISTVEYDEFVTNVIKMRPTVSEAQIIMRR